ncbi:MAG: hypothetical protein ACR2F8_13135 [Caulobacteraceae bacterium]
MQPLTDARREAFAQAFVRLGAKSAAYREAGYRANRGGAARLAAKKPVAERIAELSRQYAQTCRAGAEETIAALMALAEAADALNTAAALKEARLARLEAHRLWTELGARQGQECRPLPPILTKEEWLAAFAPRREEA